MVILWGGLTTNLIWCIIFNARNKSFGDYTNGRTPLLRNYVFAALAGSWFLQFFFYGMGEVNWAMARARGYFIWHFIVWQTLGHYSKRMEGRT